MEVEIVDLNPEVAATDYSIHSRSESTGKRQERGSKAKKSIAKTKRKRSESMENKILNYTNIQSQNSITAKEKYSKEWRRHSYGVVRQAHISDSFKENLNALRDRRRKTIDRGVEILCLEDDTVEELAVETQSRKKNRCSDIAEAEHEKSSESCKLQTNEESVFVTEKVDGEGEGEQWVSNDTEKIEMFNVNKSFSTEGNTSLKETPDSSKQEESFVADSVRIACFTLSNGVIVCLQHPSQVAFIGLAKLTMLSGQMRIMEYVVKNNNQIYDVFSSNTSCYVQLKTLYGGVSKRKALKKRLNDMAISEDDLTSVLRFHEEKAVIFLLQKSDFNIPPHRRTIFSTGLCSFYDDVELSEELVACNETLQHLGVTLESDEKVSAVYLSEDQRSILDEIKLNLDTTVKPPIIMSCGAKNSGKSTFNRLMVNSMLNVLEQVCLLDCDIGQPEFTPSGCVSLSVVEKPLLGPPFSHPWHPKKVYFYGTLSPSDNPDAYLRCLKAVVSYYKQYYSNIPLVVNTMGFVRALGLSLLKETVKMLRPSLIIQINVGQSSLNFDDHLHTILKKERSWDSIKSWRRKANNDDNIMETYSPSIKVIYSTVAVKDHASVLLASDHRDLMFVSYMSSRLKAGTSLLAQKPKVVLWTKVAIHAVPHQVPEYQMLLAINGCAVALCHTDLSKASRQDENSPWFFNDSPLFDCYGFGIVRGIDKDSQSIYVITPLSVQELDAVNTLVRGDLRIPEVIFFREGKNEVPYVDRPIDAQSLKRKFHLPRKPSTFSR